MDIRKLQRAIVDGLEDVKAQNITVFNTESLSPLFERVIIASGTSNRQTKALAASVRESVRARGMQVLRTEGEDNGEWIIVDCGAAVAHIMQPAIREYYHLEEIWGAKAVRMKMGIAKAGLPKAAEPAPARKALPPGAKAGKAGVKPAPPAAKKAARPAPQVAAPRKAPARKAGTGQPAPGRSAGAKTSAPRPGARKAAGAPAAQRPAAGAARARPAAAKKGPPRKTARRS